MQKVGDAGMQPFANILLNELEVHYDNVAIIFSPSVREPGVILDNSLTVEQHHAD